MVKRNIAILFFMFCALTSFAQSSICGVDFGESYETATAKLLSKFGEPYETSKSQLIYRDIKYAGYFFESARFSFQYDLNGSYFNECYLLSAYDSFEKAKIRRENLKVDFEDKYGELVSYKNEQGFLCYKGGVSPTDEKYYGFFIRIDKFKQKYVVAIHYGSYNYVKEEF